MLEKINEINGRLKSILNELSNEKDELSSALEVVQQRIDSKIDEAKGYKTNVDEYKAHIAGLEEEIASFEKDLNDLKENYGNKGLDAIVEVGTKEINAKIVSKQKEIAKQVEKINELTDRARTIKELLINLKKDKKDKKDRFDSVSIALEYYSGELNKIIEYSENNSESLVYLPITDEEVETDVPIIDEPIDDSPVFDEIASIDKEESSEDTDKTSEEKKDDEVEVEETTDKEISNESDLVKEEESPELENDSSLFLKDEDMNLNSFDSKFDFKLDDDNQNIFDEKTSEEDLIKEEDLEDTHFDDTISSLFATQKDNTIDFKTLNDSIDKEYENIFGKSLESDEDKSNEVNDFKFLNSKEEDGHTGLTNLDIFGNSSKKNSPDIVSNFFITNKLDFDRFSEDNQKYIRSVFSPISFTKVLEVLRKNNIELDAIYTNPNVFEMDSSELDSIISKLLISGQSVHNISLVLGTLPKITLIDLNEVINSYGMNVSKADITDIIIKAKHLSDIGKAGNL
ncbi:MAG: hypothetical protein MR765_00765 [Tenericutes bacterium]|nr:hypothetical protein [Mycoplasmatota bacterium]